jgi:hypothetical protein
MDLGSGPDNIRGRLEMVCNFHQLVNCFHINNEGLKSNRLFLSSFSALQFLNIFLIASEEILIWKLVSGDIDEDVHFLPLLRGKLLFPRVCGRIRSGPK